MIRSAILRTVVAVTAFFTVWQLPAQERQAPAYPLITHNTYFSIWSMTDQLTASTTQHWTGAEHSLLGLINVDGKIYRFMGKAETSYKTIVKASDEAAYTVKYTETAPQGEDWKTASFNDASWKSGAAPIGDDPKNAKTSWKSDNIWVRRTFTAASVAAINELFLKLNHDDNIEVYLNGKEVYKTIGWNNRFQYFPVDKANLKAGQNVIAIHLANSAGGRHLDFGLVDKAKDNTDKITVAEQTKVEFTATQTIYDFKAGNVDLKLTFTSPLLLNDLKLLSRPVSYISYGVQSNDEKSHAVKVFLGASTNIAVYQPSQEVTTKKYAANGLSILRAGTVEQPMLKKGADDMRIDWGYFYLAAPQAAGTTQFITKSTDAAKAFSNGATASTAVNGKSLSLNTVLNFGSVGKQATEKQMMLGYDEIYSVQYFNTNLRPWWNNDGKQTIEG
ncbi:MAG: DUF5127 domain-containing protein, partial [Flavitalea sp.]